MGRREDGPLAILAQHLTSIDSARVTGILIATLGLALFLAAGFAWPEVMHNATHDMRHSLGLPCH